MSTGPSLIIFVSASLHNNSLYLSLLLVLLLLLLYHVHYDCLKNTIK